MMDSGEVEGNSVEKEVGVSSSVVDADEAPDILVESLRLGIALSAVEVSRDGGGIGPEKSCDFAYLLHLTLHPFLGDEHEIRLLYPVLPIAVPQSYRFVQLSDPQAVFVGFSDLGELLEEYLCSLLLVVSVHSVLRLKRRPLGGVGVA